MAIVGLYLAKWLCSVACMPKHHTLAFVSGVVMLFYAHNDLKSLQFTAVLESVNCSEWNVYGIYLRWLGRYRVAVCTPKMSFRSYWMYITRNFFCKHNL